jgi:hypothetical protein
MNLPSALAFIIRLCPDPSKQASALAIFSSISGIGGSEYHLALWRYPS